MKLNELSYLMELTALKQKQKQKQKQKPRFLKRNEAFRGNEKKHIFFSFMFIKGCFKISSWCVREWEGMERTGCCHLIACNLTWLFGPIFLRSFFSSSPFFLYQLICWLHFQLFFASGFIFRWKNARHTGLLSGCHGDHSLLSCLVIHQERIALDRGRGKCLQSAAREGRGSFSCLLYT